jgi:hypothetical protein
VTNEPTHHVPGARISGGGNLKARIVRNVDISPMARLTYTTSLALAVGSIVGHDIAYTYSLEKGLAIGLLAGGGTFGILWLAFRSSRATRWLNRLADTFTPHDTTRKKLRQTKRRIQDRRRQIGA